MLLVYFGPLFTIQFMHIRYRLIIDGPFLLVHDMKLLTEHVCSLTIGNVIKWGFWEIASYFLVA